MHKVINVNKTTQVQYIPKFFKKVYSSNHLVRNNHIMKSSLTYQCHHRNIYSV